VSARADVCALAVMAKAPRPGRVKTRLTPPLTADQAAQLNVCFLRDTVENLAGLVAEENGAAAEGNGTARAWPHSAGLVSYTPAGEEAAFEGLLPEGFALVAQREGNFGARLLGAAEDILACGFGSVCLIDGDSPTVPRAAYEQAVRELARPELGRPELGRPRERVVIGPAADGGYYLIGMKRAHAALFEGIAWSTDAVYAQTCERARAAGLQVVELPLWYDVDDRASLEMLQAELLAGIAPGFAVMAGYDAKHTRARLMSMDWELNAEKGMAPGAGGAADAPVDQQERPG
jgi:rSAM/selenodomain-associated transferase 1